MDHAVNELQPYLEIEVELLKEEWSSGQYRKLHHCPSFKSVKALVKAINALRDYLRWERLKIRDLVENN